MNQDFSVMLAMSSAAPQGHRVGPWTVQTSGPSPQSFPHLGVTLLLKGQVYGLQMHELAQRYRDRGRQFLQGVQSACSGVILDELHGEVYTLTDPVGTHHLYARHIGQRVTISSRADHPDFTSRPYCPSALAGVLIQGVPLNGEGLHQDVQGLPLGSLSRVTATGFEHSRYWRVQPPGGTGDTPRDSLIEEYLALLRQAVQRRLPDSPGPLHLSLSGGHDSRGLLAFLARTGRDLRAFAYTLDVGQKHTDAGAARQLAQHYGIPFETLVSYRGNLVQVIQRNALQGQGIAAFCEEADAWPALQGRMTDLYTGEEMHELHPTPIRSTEELLVKYHVDPPGSLAWFTARLDPDVARDLQEGYTMQRERLRGAAMEYAQPWQRQFVVMSQQYLAHMLLPWRERYAGLGVSVHTPYLDTDVLAFLERLAPRCLADKNLFRDALRRLDPGIYSVPVARTQGYEANWTAELLSHRAALHEVLLQHPSRLDEVVPRALIASLLDGLDQPAESSDLKQQVRRTLGQVRNSSLGHRVFGQGRFKAHPIRPATLLLRLLTLRALDHPDVQQARRQQVECYAQSPGRSP